LIIAKLDRLTRDPDFVGQLYKSGVDFVAADNPHANKITVRILSAIAEHEREQISARIKAALAVKKSQLEKLGKKLGAPNCKDTIVKARAAKQRAIPGMEVLKLMVQARQEGKSFWKIAEQLNGLGVRTGTGSRWYASTVRMQLMYAQKATKDASIDQSDNPPTRAVAVTTGNATIQLIHSPLCKASDVR
jgi:DNA invertase Pin-like site-specific DNA recombinase